MDMAAATSRRRHRYYRYAPGRLKAPAATALVPAATWAIGALALGTLAATAYSYLQGAPGYVDNGDGYYLYAAHRLAQGAVLYRDVMGTQPPLVYVLGAAVFKSGGWLNAVRLASALMRGLAALLVFLVGRRLFGAGAATGSVGSLTAALAALIYALLPIGLAWDRSFDVNPPLTLVALAALWPLLRFTPRATCLAGALAALALFTKNLYLPLLATTLPYLALRRRHLLMPYLLGLLGGLAALALALLLYAGPAGWHDAFLGQESSPLDANWLVAALAYVVANEGGIVLAAVAGAWLCWRGSRGSRGARRGEEGAADYAPWLLAGAGAVLLATLKQGTAGPVFQLAEPAVALLAAYAATWPLRQQASRAATLAGLALPALVALSLASVVAADRAALARSNAAEVARVAALVRAHARPGATIVAPPYYALLSGTRLTGDAADTYILAQRDRRGDPQARGWVRRIAADLTARRIPVALIDLRLAAIPQLMAALRATYHPVYADTLPPALHVVVWLPD